MARVSPHHVPCHCRRFTCQKKERWRSIRNGQARRTLAVLLDPYPRVLKWQRAYKMACVPGLSSNETAGGVSDACIQRWLLGLADEPLPWSKWNFVVHRLGNRQDGGCCSVVYLSLSLSLNNRKEDVVDLPAYCRYKYTSSSYYKLDLKCSTKGHWYFDNTITMHWPSKRVNNILHPCKKKLKGKLIQRQIDIEHRFF